MVDLAAEQDLGLILIVILAAIFALEGVVFYCVGYRRGARHAQDVEHTLQTAPHPEDKSDAS